nr:helix-turn-helix domain-containing protein [uncultured Draconibacterium sp.]
MEKRNYRWILQLTFVFVYFIVAAFFDNIIRFFIDEALSKKLVYVMNPINILFLLWVIYKAMSQPYLFNGVDTNEKLLKDLLEDSVIRKRKEKESHLSEETSEENNLLKTKLDNYMQNTEVFLNPSLTIFDLAKSLEISVRDLSSFINNELDKHFFDFVNEYRIEKAKRILSDSEKKDFTILEILYEVGFNSKSSFNTAFKKHTGTTPTEYRKKHLISAA